MIFYLFLTKKKQKGKIVVGDNMKLTLKIFEWLVYLVGIFFILMAFSCFSSPIDSSFNVPEWVKQTLCFLIQCIPGVLIILINYFLRKKHLILGVLFILIAIFFIFFFGLYEDVIDTWPTILTIVVPTFVAGIIFLIDGVKNKRIN